MLITIMIFTILIFVTLWIVALTLGGINTNLSKIEQNTRMPSVTNVTNNPR